MARWFEIPIMVRYYAAKQQAASVLVSEDQIRSVLRREDGRVVATFAHAIGHDAVSFEVALTWEQWKSMLCAASPSPEA